MQAESTASDGQWLIIRTPDRLSCWALGEEPADLDALVTAARVVTNFPADGSWVTGESGYDIQLTLGRPHDSLLAKATIGNVADLRKVAQSAIADHKARVVADVRRRQVEELKKQIADLDDVSRAEVLAAAQKSAAVGKKA